MRPLEWSLAVCARPPSPVFAGGAAGGRLVRSLSFDSPFGWSTRRPKSRPPAAGRTRTPEANATGTHADGGIVRMHAQTYATAARGALVRAPSTRREDAAASLDLSRRVDERQQRHHQVQAVAHAARGASPIAAAPTHGVATRGRLASSSFCSHLPPMQQLKVRRRAIDANPHSSTWRASIGCSRPSVQRMSCRRAHPSHVRLFLPPEQQASS